MEQVWHWLVWFTLHRTTRYVAAWLLALGTALLVAWGGWDVFDVRGRRDPAFPVNPHVRRFLFDCGLIDDLDERASNSGHCTIDFGGQWLMGAMLARGHGEQLYNRRVQRRVLEHAYPHEYEEPGKRENEHDADAFMGWFMGTDDPEAKEIVGSYAAPVAAADPLGAAALLAAGQQEWTSKKVEQVRRPWVGGPLYPPINAFVYYPLGLLDPHDGYRVNQLLCLVYAFIAGLGVSYLTQRRFWWPLASALVLVYPGFKGAFMLGQNPPLTLAILVWGWALITRGRPVSGGVVWGLLAFKPVWAAAFFLVPFITGRWATCLAMLLTGAFLAALTLPFVGWDSWLHWLQVGHAAARLYERDQNWIFLSRDLLSMPRRFLVDFNLPSDQRDRLDATLLGWALLLTVVGLTVGLVFVRFRQAYRAVTGPVAAFLLLGAWMSCFHFMYYDILLTALPMFVLFAEPRQYLEPLFVAILRVPRNHLGDDLANYYAARPPREHPPLVPLLKAGYRNLWVLNRMAPTVLLVLMFIEHAQHKMPLNVRVEGAVFGVDLDTVREVTATVMQDGRPVVATVTYRDGVRILTTTLWHGGQPWDTYVCMFLWLWCGFLWLRTPLKPKAEAWPALSAGDVALLPVGGDAAQPVELETHVRGGHEGLADQHGADAGGLQA